MTKQVLLFCFSLLAGGLAARDGVMYKKLAGPPTEFANFKQTNPFDAASSSRAQLFPLIELNPFKLHEDVSFTVDTASLIVVGMISEKGKEKHLKVTFTSPSGKTAKPSSTVADAVGMNTGDLSPAVSYLFTAPVAGEWKARVSWSLFANQTTSPEFLSTKVFLMVTFESSSLDIWVSLTTPTPLVGHTLTIEAMVATKGGFTDGLGRPLPVMKAVDSAEMTVVEPNGKSFKEKMLDDTNGAPHDGIFEGNFMPTSPGTYNVLVDVTGKDSHNFAFRRSLWYLFRVADHTLSLTKKAWSSLYTHPITNDNIVTIDIGVDWDPNSKPLYRGYAEVWGTPSNGSSTTLVPVAWVSGLVEVAKDSTTTAGYYMRFELNTKWLDMAGAKPPLQLRNLTFEETDSFIPMFRGAVAPVTTAHMDLLHYQPNLPVKEITYEMRNGFNYYRHYHSNSSTPGKILLVHGYCSSDVPYTEDDFTDYIAVKDFEQSRTNQEFAEIILNTALDQGATKFSIASHSHGGIASLHLYTYLQSGLDATTTSGRKLQSMGTPYFGSPLAGLIAIIGDLIGVGCGPNDDLTYQVAEKWIALIPEEKQKDVFMYTTQYKTGGLLSSFCIPLVSVVLSTPNDGVAEIDKTLLPFGNLVTHEEGWCHTVSMMYPPQCKDSTRNKEINAAAAR
jgi:hypothetical protein